jgi:hypothetical protein
MHTLDAQTTQSPQGALTEDHPLRRDPTIRAKPTWRAPREHGGWVLIGVSVAAGAAMATPTPSAIVIALTLTAALAGFLAHDPLRAVLARRQRQALGPLLALGGVSGLAVLGALAVSGAWAPLWIGAIDLSLLSGYAWRLRLRGHKRIDRTTGGQALAAVVLTSAAPALVLTQDVGRTPWLPWALWAACALYFCGGILYVHALLDAKRAKEPLTAASRWLLARGFLLCHAVLAAAFTGWLTITWRPDAWGWWLVAAAPLPACARAVHRWRALGGPLPELRRVGLQELAWSIWFGLCLCIGLRALFGT